MTTMWPNPYERCQVSGSPERHPPRLASVPPPRWKLFKKRSIIERGNSAWALLIIPAQMSPRFLNKTGES